MDRIATKLAAYKGILGYGRDGLAEHLRSLKAPPPSAHEPDGDEAAKEEVVVIEPGADADKMSAEEVEQLLADGR